MRILLVYPEFPDSFWSFKHALRFIQKSRVVTAMVGLLQAPLGTRLYGRMQKEGCLVNQFSGDCEDGSTNIISKMGLEPLREGYCKLLGEIYASQLYKRVLTLLRRCSSPKMRYYPDPQYILALGRSIHQLGIRGVDRTHYWRLFFWALLRPPGHFRWSLGWPSWASISAR
jgi:hypothetical protein